MKFRRIDEDTICCIVSQEDMNEYGLELEDFFTNKEKSHDFLMNILEQAKEEVGYEAESGMLAMQLMPITRNSLAITFSENGKEGFKNMFEHMMEASNMLSNIENADLLNDIMIGESDKKEEKVEESQSNLSSPNEEKEKKQKPKNKKNIGNAKNHITMRIYEFKSFSDIEQFCNVLSMNKIITSKLLKDEKENKYFLIINKGRLTAKEYDALCLNALEFSEFVSDNPIKLKYCEEHYSLIIKKKAITIIRKLVE